MVNDSQYPQQHQNETPDRFQTPGRFRPDDPLHEQALQLAYKANPDLKKFLDAASDAQDSTTFMQTGAFTAAAASLLGATPYGRSIVPALRFASAAVLGIGAYNYIDAVHRQEELSKKLHGDQFDPIVNASHTGVDDHFRTAGSMIPTLASALLAGRIGPWRGAALGVITSADGSLDFVNATARDERIKTALDHYAVQELQAAGKPITYQKSSRDIMFPSEAFDKLNPPPEPVKPPVQPFRPPVLRQDSEQYDMYLKH